jgi:hypothetical protein
MGVSNSGFTGTIRFTPVQMQKLSRYFWTNCVGMGIGIHWKWISRWFVHGQEGHTVWGQHWSRDTGVTLWAVINLMVAAHYDYLSKSEISAYRRRQDALISMFAISAVDTLATAAWSAG